MTNLSKIVKSKISEIEERCHYYATTIQYKSKGSRKYSRFAAAAQRVMKLKGLIMLMKKPLMQ